MPKCSSSGGGDIIFYDGQCGLCHRAVQFVLAEDDREPHFRFAPLDSKTFNEAIPVEQRYALPDSLIVLTGAGEVLTRSSAVLYVLRRLGGLWHVFGMLGSCVPLRLRDSLYDRIARLRRRFFVTPTDTCPLLPPELRERFLH